MRQGKCKLCRMLNVQLINGHIIPHFLIRTFEGKQVKGFRHSDTPNRKMQDGEKRYFFCPTCDNNTLSHYENIFRKLVFEPLVYHPNLSLDDVQKHLSTQRMQQKLFAASVLLRALYQIILTKEIKNTPAYIRRYKTQIFHQQRQWRQALLHNMPVENTEIKYLQRPLSTPSGDSDFFTHAEVMLSFARGIIPFQLAGLGPEAGFILIVKAGAFIFYSVFSAQTLPEDLIARHIQLFLQGTRGEMKSALARISGRQKEKMQQQTEAAIQELQRWCR